MSKNPMPIDHMDEPVEYRSKVREAVMKRVGVQGQPLTSRDELVGAWQVAVDTSFGKLPPQSLGVYRLEADGNCVIETIAGGATHRDTGRWQWKDEGTITFRMNCAPDPDIGLEEGAVDESRYFVVALPDGRRVLWNGDGSVLLLLSRA